MKREIVQHRKNWQAIHAALRFNDKSSVQKPVDWNEDTHWQEGVCYRFSKKQIDALAQAAQNLHEMSMQVMEELVRTGDYAAYLNIPDKMIPYIETSWKRQDPALYGRFDLSYDGVNPPKLLEYNVDYCGQLVESATLQYAWANALNKPSQFNNIDTNLVTALQRLRLEHGVPKLHLAGDFTCTEDALVVDHVAHLAQQAGLPITRLNLCDIGWNDDAKEFRDLEEKKIKTIFLMRGWDDLAKDEFCGQILDHDPATFIEPSYRMILNSKAFLNLLWLEFPDHENLLAASHTPEHVGMDFVRKPVWGHQGNGVTIHLSDEFARARGIEAKAFDHVYQTYAPLPEFDGHRALTRAWIVDGVISGIGMAEDKTEIVGDKARFVPHYIY